MDLISIIVPVYNVEKYLSRCLDSIVGQSYEKIEIILVNDGSQDNSGVICEEYAKNDPRIRVIHKKNEGLGYARNTGLDIAVGKYVTFIDSDDYIGNKHIEIMYNLIINSSCDTCIAGHTKVYDSKKVEHMNVCAGRIVKEDISKEILPRMCGADYKGCDYIEMSVCMAMFSNEIIKKHNMRFHSEKEYISEDLVFDFDYYPHSKGVCVSEITDYYYCDNEGSLTTKYRKDRFVKQTKLYEEVKHRSSVLGISEYSVPRLENTLIAIARHSIKLEYKFSKVNGKELTDENVKKICKNNVLKTIFEEYDDADIKWQSRVVNRLIRHENYFLLKIVMFLKNTFHI